MAARTSVLVAWHLAAEIECFLILSHCRIINLDSSQMKLSDGLVTSFVKDLGRMMVGLVGRFVVRFLCPPCRRAFS